MSGARVELLRSAAEQADIVRNLYQYYAYESSDWEQEDVEIDGRFYIHEEHLARYWQSPRWSAELANQRSSGIGGIRPACCKPCSSCR